MSLNEKSLKLIAEYLKQFNLEGVEVNMPIEEEVYDLDETEFDLEE